MRKLIIVLSVFLMFSYFCFGEENDYFVLRGGISPKLKESLYVGADSKLTILPCLQIKYKIVNFDGDRLNIDLFQKNSFNFRIVSKLNYDGYKGSDSDYLKGMENRKGGVLGGAELEYLNFKNGQNIILSVDGDITGNSNGLVATVEAGQFIPLRKNIFFKPSIAFKYMDEKYADYYYGVKESESVIGRETYKLKDDFSLKLKGVFIYNLTERFNIIALYELEKVSSDIKNSPIIENGKAGTVILVASYKFY